MWNDFEYFRLRQRKQQSQYKILCSAFVIIHLCRAERELTGFPKELPPERERFQGRLHREPWSAAIACAGISSAVSEGLWLHSCWSSALKELNAIQMEAHQVSNMIFRWWVSVETHKWNEASQVICAVWCLACVAVRIWALVAQLSCAGSPAVTSVPGCAPVAPNCQKPKQMCVAG